MSRDCFNGDRSQHSSFYRLLYRHRHQPHQLATPLTTDVGRFALRGSQPIQTCCNPERDTGVRDVRITSPRLRIASASPTRPSTGSPRSVPTIHDFGSINDPQLSGFERGVPSGSPQADSQLSGFGPECRGATLSSIPQLSRFGASARMTLT